MKTIQLHISDRVLSELKSGAIIRQISGNAFGIADEVIVKLLKSIEENKDEVTLKYKDEIS